MGSARFGQRGAHSSGSTVGGPTSLVNDKTVEVVPKRAFLRWTIRLAGASFAEKACFELTEPHEDGLVLLIVGS